jgi:TBC1 domain family member 5
MGWALDVLLRSGSDRAGDALMTDEPHDGSQLHRREALECLAYVRDILSNGKVPKVLDQDGFLKEPEDRKRRPAPKAEEQVKEKEKEKAEQDNRVQRRTTTSSVPRASSAPLSPHIIPTLPSSSVTAPPPAPPTISPPTPYLYLRDSTPVSSLSRTPYVSPSNLSSAAPRGNRHASAPIAPWHSTPSAFGAENAVATLQRPPPMSNPSNVQSDDPQRINPTPTYHSDPLRG